jgi:hypothetical protein
MTADNDLSDIWDLSPTTTNDATAHITPNNDATDSSNTISIAQSTHRLQHEPSDLPSLRREHINAGYREGLSVGKARVIQSGFDAGYPLGVAIALKVGPILGVLEGVLAGLRRAESARRSRGGGGVGWVEKRGMGGRCRARSRGKGGMGMETRRDLEDLAIPESRDFNTGNAEGEVEKGLAETAERPGDSREREDSRKYLEGQIRSLEAELARARRELSVTALLDGLPEEALEKAETMHDLGKVDEVIRKWTEMLMIYDHFHSS